MQGGLKDLGYDVPIVTYPTSESLVFGANINPMLVPDEAVIFNLEQAGTTWMNESYISALKSHEVWDYSDTNVAWLKQKGILAQRCRLGYHECLQKIPKNPYEIDVLFYGSGSEKRHVVWREIEATGLKCKWLFGTYGKERDEWISKSRTVLNTPCYDNGTFEIVRCSYLWANNKFILHDPKYLSKIFRLGDAWIEKMGTRAGNRFRKQKQSEFLKAVL